MNKKVRALLSFLADPLRRAAGIGAKYEWSVFCDRPVEKLGVASLWGERPEGGWRAYAGAAIQRKWVDIFTIDVFLADCRPSMIIELGTGSGAFSSYLATYAYLNGAQFVTFDSNRKTAVIKRANPRALRLIRKLGGKTSQRDIFEDETAAFVRSLIQRPGVSFLYCDNGDKPKEIQMFAAALKPGDFVGVHDFGSEIHEKDVSLLVETDLTPYHPEFFAAVSSSNRIFRKRE